MKRSVAIIASFMLVGMSVAALAQAPTKTQKQKEDMARQNPIPGNKAAGSSSPGVPSTATPGSSQTTGAAGGAGAGAGGGAGAGAGGGAGGGRR